MKNILTILMLFIAVEGICQSDVIYLDSVGNVISPLFEVKDNNYDLSKPDTVKVIMLVCDTVFIKGNFTHETAAITDKGQEYSVAKTTNRVPYVFWIFGYAIYSFNTNYIYLDEKKKPLKKSMVVWMSMNIK